MKTIEGKLDGSHLKIGIVLSRFNNFIGERLLEGALDGLIRHNVDDNDILVLRVPGAFEIPSTVKQLLEKRKELDGVLCLGAVIRGSTPHFDYVAAEVSKGVAKLSLSYDTPISFGVLTTDSIEQAIERAGSKSGNKGAEAAIGLIEMIRLFQSIKG